MYVYSALRYISTSWTPEGTRMAVDTKATFFPGRSHKISSPAESRRSRVGLVLSVGVRSRAEKTLSRTGAHFLDRARWTSKPLLLGFPRVLSKV